MYPRQLHLIRPYRSELTWRSATSSSLQCWALRVLSWQAGNFYFRRLRSSSLELHKLGRNCLTRRCRLFTFVLTDGGTADLFWGFIIVAIGMSLVYASIAEMASM